MEHLHNLVTVNDRLKQALVVAFLKVSNLLAHHTEVLQKLTLSNLILTRYVGLTERHEVINVISRIVEQSTNSTVCNHLVSNDDRTHVQVNKFLDIFHLHVHRLFQTAENLWHHLSSQEVVVMERPP